MCTWLKDTRIVLVRAFLYSHSISSMFRGRLLDAFFLTILCSISDTCTQFYDYSIAALSFGEFKPCRSARRVAVWPSGRTVSSHRLRAQDPHRSQQRAHSDQLTFEKKQSRHGPRRSRDHCGCIFNYRLARSKCQQPSVFLVLRHIQAWRDPCGTQICFQALVNQCEVLSQFSNVERSSSKGKRNRELEKVQLSLMEKGENSV